MVICDMAAPSQVPSTLKSPLWLVSPEFEPRSVSAPGIDPDYAQAHRRRPVDETIRHVGRFKERQQALGRVFAERERELRRKHSAHPGLPYWLMTLHFGQYRTDALIRWCEETIKTLERLGRASAKRAKSR